MTAKTYEVRRITYLDADQMKRVKLQHEGGPFKPFDGIPFSYRRWNEGAVRIRFLKPGEVLMQQGDFGSTAFFLKEGTFRGQSAGGGKPFEIHAGHDLILGEMACVTGRRRTATIVADTEAIVYEVTRNMLLMLQRSKGTREVLEAVYKKRAILNGLANGSLFQGLKESDRLAIVETFLNPGLADSLPEEERQLSIRRPRPGDQILAQNEKARDFYMIRLGFVKVSATIQGVEQVVAILRENDHFGEIGLLAEHPKVAAALPQDFTAGRRTATVTALDDAEILRVPQRVFELLKEKHPAIKNRLADRCVEILKRNQSQTPKERILLGQVSEQGLYQAQNILVLDLERCTRCDECTKACADSHGKAYDGQIHSRLLREGLRFGQFLVATACRSCHMPYCINDCPVDAIHRDKKGLEILIDQHCIGCGLCERNCPYGSIQMISKPNAAPTAEFYPHEALHNKAFEPVKPDSDRVADSIRKALNCDLCHGKVKENQEPFCVYACPHEAAFRIKDTGVETQFAWQTLLSRTRTRN